MSIHLTQSISIYNAASPTEFYDELKLEVEHDDKYVTLTMEGSNGKHQFYGDREAIRTALYLCGQFVNERTKHKQGTPQ